MSEENKREEVLCESCGYSGDISTYLPTFSVYSDCRCPNCHSTNNKHNDDYLEMINNAFKKRKENEKQIW